MTPQSIIPGIGLFGELIDVDYRIVAVVLGLLMLAVTLHLLRER